jgi:GGDEF domain-containing protein
MSDRTDGYGLLSRLREIERQFRRLREDWKTFRDSPSADALAEVRGRADRIGAALDRLAASAEPWSTARVPEVESPAPPAHGTSTARPEPHAVVAASRQIDSMLWEVTRRWRELVVADLDNGLERITVLLRLLAARCAILIRASGGSIDRSSRPVHGSVPDPSARADSGGERLESLVTEMDGRLWQLQTGWQHIRQRPASERLHVLMEAFESAAMAGERLREALHRAGNADVRRALRIRRHMPEGTPFLPYRDPLTGVYNREGFDNLAGSELKRCRRYGRPFGLLAVRLSPPDLPGLRRAIASIRAELREYDLLARHTDDRIVIGLPEAGSGATRRVASRVIRALREEQMEAWFQRLSYATAPEDGATLAGLIDAAYGRLRP